MIDQIATDGGYHLTHATSANKGHLNSVADSFTDRWYFDDTSKKSPYTDMKDGNVELAVSVYGAGDKNSCDQTTIPDGESVVGLGVQLPSFK